MHLLVEYRIVRMLPWIDGWMTIIDAIVLLMVVELWFFDDSVDYMIYNWYRWNNVSTMPVNNLLEWMSHFNYIDIDGVWDMYIQLLCNDVMNNSDALFEWVTVLYIMNALSVTI
jgi:hypothetical protein